jgi:hypothetical protein
VRKSKGNGEQEVKAKERTDSKEDKKFWEELMAYFP